MVTVFWLPITKTRRGENKISKQSEPERWRIERADDAKIIFTIALQEKHAWEMVLEDKDHQHSISHGWAADNSRDWDDIIAPLLRRLFVEDRLGFATKRAEINPNVGRPQDKFSACTGIGAWAAPVTRQNPRKRKPASCNPSELRRRAA
jgi:hypothetical protein